MLGDCATNESHRWYPGAGQRSKLGEWVWKVAQVQSSLLASVVLFMPTIVLAVVDKTYTIYKGQAGPLRHALPSLAFALSSCIVLLDFVTDLQVSASWIAEGQQQGCSKSAEETFTLAGHLAIFFIFAHFSLAFFMPWPTLVARTYSPGGALQFAGGLMAVVMLGFLVAAFKIDDVINTPWGEEFPRECQASFWPVQLAAGVTALAAALLVAFSDRLSLKLLEMALLPILYVAKFPVLLWSGVYKEEAGWLILFSWIIVPTGLALLTACVIVCTFLWVLNSVSLAASLGSGENTIETLHLRGGLENEPEGSTVTGTLSEQEASFNRRVGAFYAVEAGPMLGLQIWMMHTYIKQGIPVPTFQWLSLAFSMATSSGFVMGVVASGKSPAMLWDETIIEACRCLYRSCCQKGIGTIADPAAKGIETIC